MQVGRTHQILLGFRILAPFLAVFIAFLYRDRIVDFIDSLFGLGFVFTVVHVYSTISVRIILLFVAFILLAAIWFALLRVAPKRYQNVAYATIGAIVVAVALIYLRSAKVGIAAGALAWCLMLINSMTREGWTAINARPVVGPLSRAFFWLGVGVEALLPRPFLVWAGRSFGHVAWLDRLTSDKARFLPGAALAAGMFALLLPYPVLMQLGQSMFLSQQASIVFGPQYHIWSRYDVSDIARNPESGDLVLCGDTQDTPKVLPAGEPPAQDIGISNGGNEFCEFSLTQRRFLTVNARTDELLVIDPEGWREAGRLQFNGLAAGEILMAAHPTRDLVAIASENVNRDPDAVDIRIVDLNRMEVIRAIEADTGYIITHPDQPVIYVNHFAMDLGVRAFDMHSGELLAKSPLFGRSDRMAFDVSRGEVLATAPELGQIRRFDGATLEEREPIKTVFGARGLAIDSERDLLLVSSFLTNQVDVIDLKTGKSLRRYRLGPWMRDIRVLSDEGVAFVASRYALYRLNYLQ